MGRGIPTPMCMLLKAQKPLVQETRFDCNGIVINANVMLWCQCHKGLKKCS